MPEDNALSIADAPAAAHRTRVFGAVLAAAILVGIAGAWHYSATGLTLSHYDARAHLVVARRIIDSLTPGWRQFGGVWLPLPHLLNALPAQWDWAYRTGAIAVALSIAILAWGLAAFAARLHARTGSIAATLTPPALILANPNVLYLQSTPMTEPMLIGLSLAALAAMGLPPFGLFREPNYVSIIFDIFRIDLLNFYHFNKFIHPFFVVVHKRLLFR